MSSLAWAPIPVQNQNARRVGSATDIVKSEWRGTKPRDRTTCYPRYRKTSPGRQAGGLPMSRNDDSRSTRSGMSPSGWHDDAVRNRDAGHDEMQAAVWRHWTSGEPPFDLLCRNETQYQLVRTILEFPIREIEHNRWDRKEYNTGRIRSFADVAVKWASLETDEQKAIRTERPPVREYDPKSYFMFYEIKPKIYSVGAIIRQCYAFSDIAQAAKYKFQVNVVVYRDDPKLDLFEELCPFNVVVISRLAAAVQP